MAAKTDSDLTRRSFVSATTGLATAVLWPSCLRAKESPREELTFVVVSDTHLGYRDKPSAAQQWKKMAAEIAKGPGELVLHLGDVVDGGCDCSQESSSRSRLVRQTGGWTNGTLRHWRTVTAPPRSTSRANNNVL